MWKQSVGDWQERRHRRSSLVPGTPQVHLPDPVAAPEHSTRGFLPRNFHDRVPASAYPASDGAETRPRSADFVTPLDRQTPARTIADTWVTVVGTSPDNVLDMRDFLDANIGRTVAHYLPPPSCAASRTVYIQFASSLQAAQAVRAVNFATRVDRGVAAVGIRRTVGDGTADSVASTPFFYMEVEVSWCTDQIFLAQREKLRQQLLDSVAPALATSSVGTTHRTSSSTGTLDSSSPHGSLKSSARLSTSPASPSAASGLNDGDAAHPILPRHRPGGSLHRGAATNSPSSIHPSLSPSPSTVSKIAAAAANAAYPPVRDPATYYQAGGAYCNEDSFFSDGLQSTGRDSRHRSTVLSLFLHPCSSSHSVVYSLCLYTPLRLLLLMLWTVANVVGVMFPFPLAGPRKVPHTRRNATSATPPQQHSLPLPLSRWKLRRTLRASDVVPASASPFAYIAFLVFKYISFSPDPEEVDVVLWSWLSLRNPYPRQSLQLLKQSLLVRQRNTNTVVSRLRPGGNGSSVGNADVNQIENFGKVDVLGGDAYNVQERRRELPVLLRWRPTWWFARYSYLSLLVLTVMASYHCLEAWTSKQQW